MSSLLGSHAAAPLTTVNYLRPSTTQFFPWKRSGSCRVSARGASGTSQYYSDINLYELLGVDSSSGKAQIKEAYRSLQKRCHPDIAGPAGHDMAIVLNEVYALLSDENSRMAYDKELAKFADLQGYTGRPIYSVWRGSENEERAVFVDEAKCVGCLKCALFAEKTFAIESVYGRARVVAQWADPEHKIQEAIGSCPVDCISVVERSDLPALEFIMSNQPRGSVRVGAGNTAGARTADVFDEFEKFQARYAHHKASNSKEPEPQTASRVSAIHAIQSITNWLYSQHPVTDSTTSSVQYQQQGNWQRNGPSINKLRAAARVRRLKSASRHDEVSNEYWLPQPAPIMETATAVPRQTTRKTSPPPLHKELTKQKEDYGNPVIRWGVPTASAVAAVVVVRLQAGETVPHVKEHMGGPLALAIVNSPWMQLVLAGVTWFLVGVYFVELAESLRRK